MPIEIACPHCNTRYNLADTTLGKQVRCKKCSNAFTVTASQPAAPVPRNSKVLPPSAPPSGSPTFAPSASAAPAPPRPASSGGGSFLVPAVIGVVVLLVGSGGAWFFLMGPGKEMLGKSGSVAQRDTAAELANEFAKEMGKQFPDGVPVPKVEDGKVTIPTDQIPDINKLDPSKLDPSKLDPSKLDPAKLLDPDKKPEPVKPPDVAKPEPEPKVPAKPEPDAKVPAKPEPEPKAPPKPDPDMKPAPKPEPEPKVTLTAPPEEKRKAVPSAADLAAADKLVKDLFKADYAKKTGADKLALAEKLYQQALETKDDARARYVLLRESRDLAASAGNLSTAFKAVDALAAEFDVNGASLKVEAIEKASPANASDAKVLVDQAMLVVDEAVEADDFDTAARIVKAAGVAAKKASVAVVNQVAAKTKEIDKIKALHQKVQTSLETLKTKADDPGANLAVGKYYCFVKGNWDKGLPHLVQGDDAKLKDLATKDLAVPTKPAEQTELGDGWYDLAAKEDPKAYIQLRAYRWYKEAMPELTGLSKTKVEKRVAELDKVAETKTDRSKVFTEIRKAIAAKTTKKWNIVGGAFSQKTFEDVPAEGAYLIGFRYTTANKGAYPGVIVPIWQTARGQLLGKVYGTPEPGARVQETKAKPGYAVGAIYARGGGGFDAFKPIYMKITEAGLDPKDKYDGPHIGGQGGSEGTLGGDGGLIVGIHGKLAGTGTKIEAISPVSIPPFTSPSRPGTPATDPLVGTWEWFRDGPLTVLADGTFTRNGQKIGTWKAVEGGNRQYRFVWGTNFTDDLTLSADGRSLDGKNQLGMRVTATRAGTAPPDKPKLPEVTIPFPKLDGKAYSGPPTGPGVKGVATIPQQLDFRGAVFSPDGKLFAALNSNSVVLWDVRANKQHAVLPAAQREASFSADGKLLATAGSGKAILLWDPAGGKQLKSLPADVTLGITLSADGKRVAAYGQGEKFDDLIVKVWDVAEGKELAAFQEKVAVLGTHVAFAPDGKTVIWRSNDGKAMVGDVDGGKAKKSEIKVAGFDDLMFSPNGQLLMVGLAGAVWEVASEKQVSKGVPKGGAAVRVRRFTSDGKLFAISDNGNRFLLFDPATSQEVGNVQLIVPSQQTMFKAVSPDGKLGLIHTIDPAGLHLLELTEK